MKKTVLSVFLAIVALYVLRAYHDQSRPSSVLGPTETGVSILTDDFIEKLKKAGMLKNNPVVDPKQRLRLVSVPYLGFDGKNKTGQFVVLDAVAPYVVEIFKTLHAQNFKIHLIKPIYLPTDQNGVGCFFDRNIINGAQKSMHAYGLAIDVNPGQNPYIVRDPNQLKLKKPEEGKIEKKNPYTDRTHMQLGMIGEKEIAVFAQHGFNDWGGNWIPPRPLDYMHFQVPRAMAQLLAVMTPEHAAQFFSYHVRDLDLMKKMTYFCDPETPYDVYSEKEELVTEYKKSPDRFMQEAENAMNANCDKKNSKIP